jgi:hypothetical protein
VWDVLEPDAARPTLSFAFFATSQSKYFTGIQDIARDVVSRLNLVQPSRA